MWFFAGAAPTRNVQERTVTWAAVNPGGQTQTFRDIELNNQYMYSVTAQLNGRLRARFNGNNGRADPGLTVPAFDAASGVEHGESAELQSAAAGQDRQQERQLQRLTRLERV